MTKIVLSRLMQLMTISYQFPVVPQKKLYIYN
jgi:hypothetical protein